MISTFTLPGRVCPTQEIRRIAAESQSPYTLLQLKPDIEWVYLGLERMVQVMEMTGATMVYADHFQKMMANGEGLEAKIPRCTSILVGIVLFLELAIEPFLENHIR